MRSGQTRTPVRKPSNSVSSISSSNENSACASSRRRSLEGSCPLRLCNGFLSKALRQSEPIARAQAGSGVHGQSDALIRCSIGSRCTLGESAESRARRKVSGARLRQPDKRLSSPSSFNYGHINSGLPRANGPSSQLSSIRPPLRRTAASMHLEQRVGLKPVSDTHGLIAPAQLQTFSHVRFRWLSRSVDRSCQRSSCPWNEF